MHSRRVFGAILAVAMTGQVMAATIAPIPTAAFFKRPLYSNVKISPDGRYLALVGPVKGDASQTQLDLLDVKTLQLQGHYKLKDQQQVGQLWWAGSHTILFTSVIQTGTFDEPLRTGVIWGVDLSTDNTLGIAYPASIVDVPKYDPGAAMIEIWGDPPSGGLIDVSDLRNFPTINKASTLAVKSPIANGEFYTDNDENFRLALGFNEKTVEPEMFYHVPGTSHFDWKDISSLIQKEQRYSAYGPVMFTPDNSKFYFKGVTPDGTLGLYIIDPATLKKTLLYSDPGFDIDHGYSTDDWLTSADGRSLVAFLYDAERPQWIVVDKKDPQTILLASLQNAFTGQAVDITSTTLDGSKSIIYVYSDRNPGQYYLYDAKLKQVKFLFSNRPDIDPDQMAEMQPITFKARDGMTIHGYLTLPRGASKNVPLIVHPHGGPFGIRDEWGFDGEVQFLAYHGYAVLQVEYRGSGGYGYAFQRAGYKQWGGTMQDDLTDATDWAIQQGIADPKRICIYGASYGGYAALEGVEKEPDLYRCAIGYAGVYDLELMRGESDTLQGRDLAPFMDVTVGDDKAILREHSPYLHVDKIKAALFLAHGGQDRTARVEHVDELRDALDKIHKHYDWVYYRNEAHGFYTLEHNVDLYTKMLAFLDKNIGPGATVH
ncbi:MAG: alpha/beta hydrolase family protein [Gammaproteobacteria bacterium]